MEKLNLSADAVLTTTRAVRKRLDFDREVEREKIEECVSIALQAPTGSNEQGWHFVTVYDADKRRKIADYYREAWQSYRNSPSFAAFTVHKDEPQMQEVQEKMVSSTDYLAQHLDRVPVFVIPCIKGRYEKLPEQFAPVTRASAYGSIIPAAWSFMLAARERGLGTVWTTLHLFYEKEIAKLLGIPHDEVTQVALIPVAYSKGTAFKPGPRKELDTALHVDGW